MAEVYADKWWLCELALGGVLAFSSALVLTLCGRRDRRTFSERFPIPINPPAPSTSQQSGSPCNKSCTHAVSNLSAQQSEHLLHPQKYPSAESLKSCPSPIFSSRAAVATSAAATPPSSRRSIRQALNAEQLADFLSKQPPHLQPPARRRDRLPHNQIYGDSIPLMALVKRTLPIHAYEPLGILQAICEELRFAGPLLNRLGAVEEAEERMCAVVSFIISGYSGMVTRNRKPFNPLLGETYDYVSEDGWKYVAEQVSHHPPMSACYADGPGWEWFQTLHGSVAASFDGSTSLTALLPVRIRLASGEEYAWNKVMTIVQNARAEAHRRRVVNEGQMTVYSSSGLEARLKFMEPNNLVKGEVRTKEGKILFQLVGCWDKGLNRVSPGSNEQEPLFEVPPLFEHSQLYYGFSKFTVGLNELHDPQYLPQTDSRLRPDQRFLESGDVKAADEAKKELERVQRLRNGNPHQRMWFQQERDAFSNQQLWLTNGRYWPAKQSRFTNPESAGMLRLFEPVATPAHSTSSE